MPNSKVLEPQIKEQNFRQRFKLYKSVDKYKILEQNSTQLCVTEVPRTNLAIL